MTQISRSFLSISITTLLIFFNSCAVNPVSGKRQLMFISESQEIAMGKKSDPEVVAFFGLYQDESIQQFINEKGQAMAKVSHRPNLKYEFKVLDSPVVNAFAVPGGYVYFTRGILAHFNNEAEFSGVLGHEIGHITARHSVSQMTKQTLSQVGLAVGMIAVPQFAQYGNIASENLQSLFLKFSRDDESQSDKLGVAYSTAVGYNSHEMANFFSTINRIQNQAGVDIPDFQSTHPNPEDREKRVHELSKAKIEELGLNKSTLKVNRDNYLRMIDGLTYGEDPRQGFVENNMFYHPELKFQFPVPAKWNTQNSPSQFVMSSPDDKTAMIMQLGKGETTKAAAEKFISENKLTLKESKNTTVNGFATTWVLAQQVDQNSGTTLIILTYFIKYGDLIYNTMGLAVSSDYANHKSDFIKTMTGFKKLTNKAKLNVQPDRIRIKEILRPTTLSQALKSYNTKNDQLATLAIINGMELSDQLEKGTLIKVVGK